MPDDAPQRPAVVTRCASGHEYPAMAGECPYCLGGADVQAPDAQGRPRFAKEG